MPSYYHHYIYTLNPSLDLSFCLIIFTITQMGNAALCVPSLASSGGGGSTKVVSCDGRMMVYTRAPVRAAEIMLENPGQFLCESRALRAGQRIPGLCAEQVLERGQQYFLLPMEMLYSVPTDEEMNWLTTNRATRGVKTIGLSRIFPEFCLFPNASAEEAAGGGRAAEEEEGERWCCRQRSWRPGLETIVEI